MNQVELNFHEKNYMLDFPDEVDILGMGSANPLSDPARKILQALDKPISAPSLREIIRSKNAKASLTDLTAAIVVSDTTRPVPYRGPSDILKPLVNILIAEGVKPENIRVLIATGTHRGLTQDEIAEMVEPSVLSSGIQIINHDCLDVSNLTHLGETSRGSSILINSLFIDSDMRILTGLVESHFMAGVSGGRKSVCPGLVGEESTYIFHGPEMMAHPMVKDLQLEGNPCHEESLEFAKAAGVDFILNVTLDHEFNITGVFAGDLEAAHLTAADFLTSYVGIPVEAGYDAVIVHGGFVGKSHYQAGKAAVTASTIIRSGGMVLLVSDNTDADPIGSLNYRTGIQLLKIIGPQKMLRLLKSPDWTFLPEQWQVQMWCKLFNLVSFDRFFYYSPQFGAGDYASVPGLGANSLIAAGGSENAENGDVKVVIEKGYAAIRSRLIAEGITSPRIAYLKDGPYGIPLVSEENV
ncbi:MAG: nickel-dependent lactate racemase [Spirochaetales bacterium]|nr:nickel-dependent lactate racemase [Spirochaetales bacterium]